MFGPFDTIPDQRAMQTSCLGSFSVIWVPKLLLTSARNWIFWPKNGQIWPKTVIFGQISAFFAHFIQCPTKKQFRQVAQVVPRWVQKLLLTPTRIRNFGQKAAIFGKNWFFWPIIGIFGPFGLTTDLKTTSIMWVPKLLLSPVNTRIFCPKTTKFCPKLAFLVILG